MTLRNLSQHSLSVLVSKLINGFVSSVHVGTAGDAVGASTGEIRPKWSNNASSSENLQPPVSRR